MLGRFAALLASLVWLSACHLTRPDHSDSKGVPPRSSMELTWETFFEEPWRDPLHEKYEELFREPFPNRPRQHFATERPFSDVKKYELAFDGAAVPGARKEIASAGGEHSVSLQLPDSAGRAVDVQADDINIRLSVVRPLPTRRYRAYRSEDTIIPLPTGADPATARVERDGDWVRIRFNSRTPGRPHAK